MLFQLSHNDLEKIIEQNYSYTYMYVILLSNQYIYIFSLLKVILNVL